MKTWCMVAILCVLAGWAAGADQTYSLRPRLEAGRYALTHTQEVEDGLAGGVAPLSGYKSTVQFEAQLVADTPSAKGQTFELEIKRVRHTLRDGEAVTTYDSDKPAGATSAAQPMLQALARTKLKFTLDAKGQITQVRGTDAVWEKMRGMDPTIPPAGTDDKQAIQDFVLRDIVLLGQDLLPAKPVALGERWTVQQPWLPMQKHVAKMDCAMTRVEKGVAAVECTSEPAAAGGGADAPRQQVKASLRVDVKTGLLANLTLDVQSQTTYKPGKDEKEAQTVQTQSGIRSESVWKKIP